MNWFYFAACAIPVWAVLLGSAWRWLCKWC